jgi:hypothetical protein
MVIDQGRNVATFHFRRRSSNTMLMVVFKSSVYLRPVSWTATKGSICRLAFNSI